MDKERAIKQEARIDERALEELLNEYRQDLRSCASLAVNRFITEKDEEWSVALLAFYEAAESYEPDRGAFWPFASTVIKRRLNDFLRVEYRHSVEICVPNDLMNGELPDPKKDPALSCCEEIRKTEAAASSAGSWPGKDTILDEIEALQEELDTFGISFFDLTECSPKAKKSREKCVKAIASIFDPPPLIAKMRKKHSLPASEVVRRSGISAKILDKHRKYLIASAVILDGDYPLLSEYLEPVRKEIKGK